MTKEEIIQGNKLIAEFLGGEVRIAWVVQKSETWAWYGEVAKRYRRDRLAIRLGDAITIEMLKFHDSFDWLMEAAHKAYEEVNPFVSGRDDMRTALATFNCYEVWKVTCNYINIINNESRREIQQS
jgi:hypothetical protein